MKIFVLLLVGCLSATLFGETVVKTSASFSFPTMVGIRSGNAVQNSEWSFSYWPGSSATSNAIILSWALPTLAGKGTLSIFNVAGKRVKSFPITSSHGVVKWDASLTGKNAKGVYFATIALGAYKKNIKIFVY